MEQIHSQHTGIAVDLEAKGYFFETAKWAKFFGILGFIFCGLFLLIALILFVSAGMIAEMQNMEGTPLPKWLYSFIGFMYFIMSVIGIYVSLLLYRFGDRTIIALNTEQQPLFTNAVKNLRTVFRVYGIFSIIYLVMIVLALIGGIIGGMLTS